MTEGRKGLSNSGVGYNIPEFFRFVYTTCGGVPLIEWQIMIVHIVKDIFMSLESPGRPQKIFKQGIPVIFPEISGDRMTGNYLCFNKIEESIVHIEKESGENF